MADFFDLLHIATVSPESLKQVLDDKNKINAFNLTSDQLELLKKINPDQIKMLIDTIDYRLRIGPVAGTNACCGTNACSGGSALSHIPIEKVARIRK